MASQPAAYSAGMQILVMAMLAWIAINDARTHRIPNRDLLILVIIALLTGDLEHLDLLHQFYTAGIVLIITILLSLFCGVGMGDVKLLTLLAMLILPSEFIVYQIFVLTVLIAAVAHALLICRGDIRRSLHIPLAPAIFLGTIIALTAK